MKRPRSIKRVCAFVVLGAVVNVAVGWAAVAAEIIPHRDGTLMDWFARIERSSSSELRALDAIGLRPQKDGDDCWMFVFKTERTQGRAFEVRKIFETETTSPDCDRSVQRIVGYRHLATFIDAGWPLHSLAGCRYQLQDSSWNLDHAIEIDADRTTGDPMILPCEKLGTGTTLPQRWPP